MEPVSDVDAAALRLAIEQTRAEDEAHRQQIDSKLKTESWEQVGAFAAMHRQTRALRLPPWQKPPCVFDPDATPPEGDDLHGERKAIALLRQMLALGVSRYDPDPQAAIEAAERKRTAA